MNLGTNSMQRALQQEDETSMVDNAHVNSGSDSSHLQPSFLSPSLPLLLGFFDKMEALVKTGIKLAGPTVSTSSPSFLPHRAGVWALPP